MKSNLFLKIHGSSESSIRNSQFGGTLGRCQRRRHDWGPRALTTQVGQGYSVGQRRWSPVSQICLLTSDPYRILLPWDKDRLVAVNSYHFIRSRIIADVPNSIAQMPVPVPMSMACETFSPSGERNSLPSRVMRYNWCWRSVILASQAARSFWSES